MLLVTHVLLIPVAGPHFIEDGWMLIGDDGTIDSLGRVRCRPVVTP